MERKTTVSYVTLGSYKGEIHLPKRWLEEQINTTMDEFLDEYTWDDTQALYADYLHAR
ncbi:hypothetical protein [Halobacillus ihumii]|uniref:hypothetical protein n=1 Tax=Halobacillus ihumii TaxID=2686092 RepID=UPI0013D3F7D8|nr:hypothetical protein [Halobacillus ihumii]